MAKRRGRAISIDGLIAQLSALDKQRIAIQERIGSAIRSLGVPSPFAPLSAPPRRGRPAGSKSKTAGVARKRRKMSAKARKAIGDAQRKRWAKVKGEKK